jgi:hypothetical protein
LLSEVARVGKEPRPSDLPSFSSSVEAGER